MYFIAMTGHRDCDFIELTRLLKDELSTLRYSLVRTNNPKAKSNRTFLDIDIHAYCGGAVGADLIFGLSCIDFKIPLTMKLPDPFYYKRSVKPHPDKRWIERFHTVRDYADEIQYSGDTNDWRNNFKRNVDMISPADLVYVAYRYDDLDQYTGTTRPRTGGTSHGIMTAKKFERKIIHLKVT